MIKSGLDCFCMPFVCHLSNTSLKASASSSLSVYISIVTHLPLPALPPTEFIQNVSGNDIMTRLSGLDAMSSHRFEINRMICTISSFLINNIWW